MKRSWHGAARMNTQAPIPSEYRGWWRITETSQWSSKFLDSLGPALLSLTGHGDRLRMHCLLAYVNCKPTKTGVSFTWEGAWEYDSMAGTGRVTLGKDGRSQGIDSDQGPRLEHVRRSACRGARRADQRTTELSRQVATPLVTPPEIAGSE
ncbi:MAG: hypothetical protein KC766_40760 [Myxococcales bacterium]|nr:hypothetical protein [Myxococcales bacterium]